MTGGRVRTLVVDDEPVARAHLRALLEDRGDIAVVGECGDGRTAIDRIRALSPDLVLLDVQMPELDGFGVVRAIGPDRMPAVVFVTAHDQHAVEAFEVHALDYVLKPVHRSRFNGAIDRAIELIRSGAAGRRGRPLADALERVGSVATDRIAIRSGDRVLYLRVGDIDWIEAADDLVRLHVGKAVHDHRATMAQIEKRLPAPRFLRIHRSTIVNVDRIREFQPWFQGDWILVLADGTRLQSGKSYRRRIRALIDR
ncbi:MAG: response regulator transcription factor [Gemmatimonadaceae bacterium]|nr:response regulator transcription factor [Gemmatimonadaceae bacterium]